MGRDEFYIPAIIGLKLQFMKWGNRKIRWNDNIMNENRHLAASQNEI